MRRILHITVVAFFVSSGIARGGLVLLATHNGQAGAGVAPQDEARVELTLELYTVGGAEPGPRLGTGISWREGDSGTVDFTAENDLNFVALVALATNGFNDKFRINAIWPDGTGGGGGGFESALFGRSPHAGEPPDLVGYELELIRLTVDNVDFKPWPGDDGDGYFVHVDLRYEFFGSVIPEPATLVLLVSAGMIKLTRRHIR